MADKTSAVMNYVDTNGNKGSKTITDVDPTAAFFAITDFVRGLNSLTTNTISSIEKVERTDITNKNRSKPAPITQQDLVNMIQELTAEAFTDGFDMFYLTPASEPNLIGKVHVKDPIIYPDDETVSNLFGLGVMGIENGFQYCPFKGTAVTFPTEGLTFEIVIDETDTTADAILRVTVPAEGTTTIEII